MVLDALKFQISVVIDASGACKVMAIQTPTMTLQNVNVPTVMVDTILVPNRSLLVNPFLSPKNHFRTKYAGSFFFSFPTLHSLQRT